MKPVPMYTVFDCLGSFPCDGCQLRNCIRAPNRPTVSLDQKRMLVTGIFEKSPNSEYLSQAEAEALILTEEWADPVESP